MATSSSWWRGLSTTTKATGAAAAAFRRLLPGYPDIYYGLVAGKMHEDSTWDLEDVLQMDEDFDAEDYREFQMRLLEARDFDLLSLETTAT